MLKTFFKKYYTDYYTLFFIGNGQNLLIHPKSEEGEVALYRIVGPYLAELLGEFEGGGHAGALVGDETELDGFLLYVRVHWDDEGALVDDVAPDAEINGGVVAYHPTEEHTYALAR